MKRCLYPGAKHIAPQAPFEHEPAHLLFTAAAGPSSLYSFSYYHRHAAPAGALARRSHHLTAGSRTRDQQVTDPIPHTNGQRLRFPGARLNNCSIPKEGCAALASAVKSNPSHLIELNLGFNKLGESAVKLLSDLLENPQCKLQKLQLYNCSIPEKGCAALASAMRSNPSHLRELNLGYNKLGDSGMKPLSDLLENPQCKLKRLTLYNCSLTKERCADLASALKSNPSHLRKLNLNGNNLVDSGMMQLSDLLKDTHCKLEKLQLHNCHIGAEGCAALFSALRLNPLYMRELDLSCNKPDCSGLQQLSDLLKDPQCKLEKLQLYSCCIEEAGCAALVSALTSNPPHLIELNLRCNKLGDLGEKQLSDIEKDPHHKLNKIYI